MKFNRILSAGTSPVEEQVMWKVVRSEIRDDRTGKIIHEQDGVEVPEQWSEQAVNILSQKYFRKAGVPSETEIVEVGKNMPAWLFRSGPHETARFGGETSGKQVFHRLAGTWTYWGWKHGYFDSEVDARIFYDEVYLILALQYAAPNSPQWFNTGLHWAYGIQGKDDGQWYVPELGADEEATITDAIRAPDSYERPQPHACFLTGTEDNLVGENGIMETWSTEARIFKYGSGSGVNVSPWRGKNELLSGGGRASGVMSWLSIGDRAAGSIASGGTTRRAAKLVLLDDDHPELPEFIEWKQREEHKAASMFVGSQLIKLYAEGRLAPELHHLIPPQTRDRLDHGFEAEVFGIGYEEEANRTIDGQNSNNSIRVTDNFLARAAAGLPWELYARTTGEVVKTIPAQELLNTICRAAWACADPGMIFHDTVNDWNTCTSDGIIRTSNPCFTGDTQVWTIEGPRRFDELAESGNTISVLTELSDGKLAFRPMTAPRLTRQNTQVCEIIFKAQRGPKGNRITTLRCTPDHQFFLRDGSTKQAGQLRPGDRIESAYRAKANQNDWQIRSTNSLDVVFESHLMAEYDHGRRPQYPLEHAHHLDKDHSNNIPGNVEVKNGSEHNSEHMRGDKNPMRRWFGKLSPEEKKAHTEKFSRPGSSNPNFGNVGHLSDRRWINNGSQCRRIKPNEVIPEGWLLGYLRLNSHQSEETRAKRGASVRAAAERRRSGSNHTVISVTELLEPSDVFCGTVQDTGRFFVALGDDLEHMEGVLVSNCAEFHHLDWSACNLASLRLTAFLLLDGTIDVPLFEHVCRLVTIILDISVTMAAFPAPEFAVGAYNYRTLGIGYSDLGGLLMRLAISYDSDEGRALAATITALMTGVAYRTSAEMAEGLGSFPRLEANHDHFKRVMSNHRRALYYPLCDDWVKLNVPPYCVARKDLPSQYNAIYEAAVRAWDTICASDLFRNAQVSLIAPTGTISFSMDCKTTGMEPEFALVKYKNLAGGGTMRIVNGDVEEALVRLGYETNWIKLIVKGIEEGKDIKTWWPEGMSCIKPEDLPVFACANELRPEAHILMLAAIQPFLSGAASKTINLAASATVDDVCEAYLMCHRLGIKAVALYRNGSKLAQPLQIEAVERQSPVSTITTDESPHLVPRWGPREAVAALNSPPALARGDREYLPWRREGGFTQKAKIGDRGREQTVFWRVSNFPDGRPGELFIELAKQGSTMRAIANCLAISISIGLQHGVPLEKYVDQFIGVKFEPAGYVEGHDHVSFASSFVDLLARDLAIEYLGREDLKRVVAAQILGDPEKIVALSKVGLAAVLGAIPTGEACPDCGGELVQTGRCLQCPNCNWNEGCSG